MNKFKVNFLGPTYDVSGLEGNVDINVHLEGKGVFFGTVFTPENIQSLMERYQSSGENSGGIYFWACNMIIVKKLEIQLVEEMITDLLEDGSFFEVFEKIS